MIPGRATPDGTRRYADRQVAERGRDVASYRLLDGLTVSTIGAGTYLGDADDVTDVLYTEAIIEAIGLGINHIDSAVNYRFQRSERAIGEALRRAVASGTIERDAVVIATKGGYVPFDGEAPSGPGAAREYVSREFLSPGVCKASDFANQYRHCIAPGYLSHQIDRSCENLGVETIDVYYLHNTEGQIAEVGRETFEQRLRDAFSLLESKVVEGKIVRYGLATWNGFRAEPGSKDYLPLERITRIAHEVAGKGHHFRVIQLPYNLAMTEAFGFFNQPVGEKVSTALEAAARLGVSAVASASLLQSKLAEELPPEVVAAFDLPTNAQRALQFVRSTPGVASALVGMSHTRHVRENAKLLSQPLAPDSAVFSLFDVE
jgi:aryl-alcohol dehydrogenase-like predicted oxidoreductase